MFARTMIALLAALLAQTPAERSVAFWDVSVVDPETGSMRAGMVVEISKGRITRVEPAAGAARPRNAIVAGAGRFLIPGLWDCHVHLTKVGAAALPVFLANGVTSVRDMGSDLAEVLEWRKEIESGARPGPRIKTSGQILESRANVERMKRGGTVEPVGFASLSVSLRRRRPPSPGSPTPARTFSRCAPLLTLRPSARSRPPLARAA